MPRPGSTTARGYGWKHQKNRARYAPTVNAGRATCWRCQRPIQAPAPGHTCKPGCRAASCWDVGHDDHDRSITRGPEHRHRNAHCLGNRAAGSVKANRKKKPQTLSYTNPRW
jgi:hypothetical protein